MKRNRIFLAVAVLTFASLSCQVLRGGRNDKPAATSEPATTVPTPSNDIGGNDGTNFQTDFLMAGDAFNITDMGNDSLVYYTHMSLEDLLKFYREGYSGRDYTERELLTEISENTFNLVFDGDPSGKAVVIQSVDLGDGSRTVAIRLEDL